MYDIRAQIIYAYNIEERVLCEAPMNIPDNNNKRNVQNERGCSISDNDYFFLFSIKKKKQKRNLLISVLLSRV